METQEAVRQRHSEALAEESWLFRVSLLEISRFARNDTNLP
jgi:hypothetical protein